MLIFVVFSNLNIHFLTRFVLLFLFTHRIEAVFKPCLLKIKPGNDNYLTDLVRAASLVVKAIKMEIYEQHKLERQKAEMCPNGQDKIARSP